MEQVELTLPEYFSEVSEEIRQYLFHPGSMMFLSVYELIYVLSGAESITPDLHLQGDFQLMIAEFEHLLKGVFLVELDREGDL